MASLSNSGLAHPPRSNPPLRFSSGPPFPCTTPSTETCVVVVSFMIAVPLLLGGAPRGRPLTPATNTSASIRHRLPDFFRGLSGTPVLSDPTARRFRGDCAPLPHVRASADQLWVQINREDPASGPGTRVVPRSWPAGLQAISTDSLPGSRAGI